MSDQGASYNAISEIIRLQKENQQLREDKTELLAELYSLAFDEGILKNVGALPKWTATLIQPIKGDAMKTAKLMWDAYAIQAGGKTFDGKPLPTWDELGEDRQSCWVAAASATTNRIEKLEEEIGVLFAANVRLNSRADLDSDGYVDRIEKLEAALQAVIRYAGNAGDDYLADKARKALEGKDD